MSTYTKANFNQTTNTAIDKTDLNKVSSEISKLDGKSINIVKAFTLAWLDNTDTTSIANLGESVKEHLVHDFKKTDGSKYELARRIKTLCTWSCIALTLDKDGIYENGLKDSEGNEIELNLVDLIKDASSYIKLTTIISSYIKAGDKSRIDAKQWKELKTAGLVTGEYKVKRAPKKVEGTDETSEQNQELIDKNDALQEQLEAGRKAFEAYQVESEAAHKRAVDSILESVIKSVENVGDSMKPKMNGKNKQAIIDAVQSGITAIVGK